MYIASGSYLHHLSQGSNAKFADQKLFGLSMPGTLSSEDLENLSNLMQDQAGALAKDYVAALKQVQECSLSISSLQKELKAFLDTIYEENATWIGASLGDSLKYSG